VLAVGEATEDASTEIFKKRRNPIKGNLLD